MLFLHQRLTRRFHGVRLTGHGLFRTCLFGPTRVSRKDLAGDFGRKADGKVGVKLLKPLPRLERSLKHIISGGCPHSAFPKHPGTPNGRWAGCQTGNERELLFNRWLKLGAKPGFWAGRGWSTWNMLRNLIVNYIHGRAQVMQPRLSEMSRFGLLFRVPFGAG